MKLNPIRANMNELILNRDTAILFSYQTPVAGWDEQGAFRTGSKYSQTTTRHINEYLGGKDIGRVVPQEYINRLTKERF